MIKVLHVVTGMNRGGIETFIMNVYRNIKREDIQFDFMTHVNYECDYDKEISELGGQIFNISPRNAGLLKSRKEAEAFFAHHGSEYAAIHIHVSSLSSIIALVLAKKSGIDKRIIHAHSTSEGGRLAFFHNMLSLINRYRIDAYVTDKFACADTAAEWVFGKKSFRAGEVKIIKNGIDSKLFVFNLDSRTKVRKEFGLNEQFVIGHVGRFEKVKNHLFLIDVFKEFCKTHPLAVLLLVGDGNLLNEAKEKAKDCGLSDCIIFAGKRSDVSAILNAMDAFAFPSLYEGLPVTLIEAQASSLKCLVSDRITRQIEITDNVEYISVDQGVGPWIASLEKAMNCKRVNMEQQVKEAGYDIVSVSEYLTKCYNGESETDNALGTFD